MGREKQLLEDIKNGNYFYVELVARNLDSGASIAWTHTFIDIHSIDKNGKKKEYTIWWQMVNKKLAGIFNHPGDHTILWLKETTWINSITWVFKPAWFKESVFFDTPTWMADWQFVQNIYDEYVDYNKNHQVNFNILSKPFWNDNSWNCSNLATTLLTRASKNDKTISNKISNMDTTMFNWWLWESINY